MDDRRADLRLDVVADDRHAGDAEAFGPGGIAGDEDRDIVDEGDAGIERARSVKLGRGLAADGQVVHHHVGLRRAQPFDDAVVIVGCGIGDDEGAVGGRVGHVLGDAVEHRPHRDDCPGRLDVAAEYRRAVGLGEDRAGDVAADLARVDVPRRDDVDVARAVAADFGMKQPGGVVRAVTVMLEPLDERARAVADPDDGDADLAHAADSRTAGRAGA